MAIIASCIITQATDCSAMTFVDNSTLVPTPVIASVTIEILMYGSTVPVSFTVTGTDLIDLFDPLTGYTINASNFNSLLTSFTDGIYSIKYTLNIGRETYSYYTSILFSCSIDCCIRKKRLSLPLPYSPCEAYEILMLAEHTYEALQDAVCCGNLSAANDFLTWLTDFCANCMGVITKGAISARCGCSGGGTVPATPIGN